MLSKTYRISTYERRVALPKMRRWSRALYYLRVQRKCARWLWASS